MKSLKKEKGKEMQDCRREGERRVISWAGELRWRQSSSRCQRGEWKEGVLFGFLGIPD
jgi:hypothetical protein